MFKRVLSFLARPWLLILIGFIALGLLVWFAGPLIAIADYMPLKSVWARVLLVCLLPVMWLLLRFRVRFTDRRAARRLERSLNEAGTPAAPVEANVPDPEQSVLAERLQRALQTLQSARLSRGRRLYQLPWYVIIGAPGSGKSTLLKRSGLRFPLQSQLGDDPLQGAGGTRYCDWWFTDEAVFIDTAGRYTMQDNPQESSSRAWFGFLGLLRRSRPKRPLNGIVVTIAILDLLHKTPTQLAMQATAIKRRIQELNEHLRMELPVYLLFTKCDLLAGFTEFFQDLEDEDREAVWGVTLPYSGRDGAAHALTAFPARYGALIARAANRVPLRLRDESSPRRRALIYEFPRQMLGLKDKLDAFLRDIFLPNQFEQPALLRGAYFVSGTQTAAPATRVSGVLPPALSTPPLAVSQAGPPRSYFLTRLLRGVIFSESELAGVNRSQRRRFRWAWSGAFAVVVASFVAVSALWLTCYAGIQSYLDDVAERIEDFRSGHSALRTGSATDWMALATTLDKLRALPERSGADWMPNLGLEQQQKITAQAGNTYQRMLEVELMPAVTELLLAQFDLAGDNAAWLYHALRSYLMLYHREHLDRDAVRIWLGISWERELPGGYAEPVRRSLSEHLRVALASDLLPPPMDEARVTAARELLLATPLDRRLYVRLQSEYESQAPQREFSVVDVLGARAAQALLSRNSGKPLSEGIPAYYTYEGLHRGFQLQRLKLAEYLTDTHWVYDDHGRKAPSPQELESLAGAIEALYYEHYIGHWRGYLEDLELRGFRNAEEGRVLAQQLAGGEASLLGLLQEIHRHTDPTTLPAGAETLAKVAEQLPGNQVANQRRRLEHIAPGVEVKLPGQPVADAFAVFNRYISENEAAGPKRLQDALTGYGLYLETLAHAPARREAAFSAMADPAQNAAALQTLETALRAAPPVLGKWLAPIRRAGWRVTAASATAHVNELWRNQVLSFYDRAIAGRYPFQGDAEQDVRIEDFTEFFGPGGILDRFFQAHLAPLVDTGTVNWRWRRSIGLSASSLRMFQQVQRIREAYFAGSGAPQVEFIVRPQRLDQTVIQSRLEAGASQVSYQHGPVRSTPLRWDFDGAGRSRLVLTLAGRDTPVSTSEDGQWSLFRLLDRHSRSEPTRDGSGLLVHFEVEGLRASYVLQPLRGNPLTRAELRDFTPPRRL